MNYDHNLPELIDDLEKVPDRYDPEYHPRLRLLEVKLGIATLERLEVLVDTIADIRDHLVGR